MDLSDFFPIDFDVNAGVYVPTDFARSPPVLARLYDLFHTTIDYYTSINGGISLVGGAKYQTLLFGRIASAVAASPELSFELYGRVKFHEAWGFYVDWEFVSSNIFSVSWSAS